jgi:hypothetical protein
MGAKMPSLTGGRARPAVSEKRLSLLSNGKECYELKSPDSVQSCSATCESDDREYPQNSRYLRMLMATRSSAAGRVFKAAKQAVSHADRCEFRIGLRVVAFVRHFELFPGAVKGQCVEGPLCTARGKQIASLGEYRRRSAFEYAAELSTGGRAPGRPGPASLLPADGRMSFREPQPVRACFTSVRYAVVAHPRRSTVHCSPSCWSIARRERGPTGERAANGGICGGISNPPT